MLIICTVTLKKEVSGNCEKITVCVTSVFWHLHISKHKGPESPVFTLTGPGLGPESGLLKIQDFS